MNIQPRCICKLPGLLMMTSLAYLLLFPNVMTLRAAGALLNYKVTVETPLNAPTNVASGACYWMQARAAVIPAMTNGESISRPRVVMTMQLEDNKGTHMYHGLADMWSDDFGKTWHGPTQKPALSRRPKNQLIEVPVDATPQWHAASAKVLLTGGTFLLSEKIHRNVPGGRSYIAYAVYKPETDSWTEWQKLDMPDDPEFYFARAGCSQRVDLPNGDILLPIYCGWENNSLRVSTVLRCHFDGVTLRYVEHGDELSIDIPRGFGEPSLTKYGDMFYLTLRNDREGYVAKSKDGLHFTKPKKWRFDDGRELGSDNTQTHWVTHSDGLFLAYTRRGAGNDDIIRHRAPLFMGQVDIKTLRVIRKTERILLPKSKFKGGFGNFGVRNVSPEETWVTAGRGRAQPGEPSVYITRIHWSKPNSLYQLHE